MKTKWSLIALCIAAATVANAQGIRFGAKGGLNVATVKFNDGIFDSDNMTGFHIGPILEVMTLVPGIGVDVAVLFTQKGGKVHYRSMGMYTDDIIHEYEQVEAETTAKVNFIEVPVNLKWKMILPLVKPYIAAGPYISFPISGEWYLSYGDVLAQVKNRSFGAGLNFAAGVEVLSMLQVSVNYNLGLTDHFKDPAGHYYDTDSSFGRTRTWVISAAVFF
jgi:hypothetical protein